MEVSIPAAEAPDFGQRITTEKYRKDERDYKWAVHLVLSKLLSAANSERPDFPELIRDAFGNAMPDLARLGLTSDDQAFVKTAVGGGGGLRTAMGNLAGGKWGLAQFAWFPRAVEYGLGSSLGSAFRALVDGSHPISERVDTFRDQLYITSEELQKKGGYLPGWTLFRVSLSFVAVVLAAYDPSKYTFYSNAALRSAYRRYTPQTEWPVGTRGQVYAEVCEFVASVAETLKKQGVQLVDLIDAQSFIWIKYQEQQKSKGVKPVTVIPSNGSDQVDLSSVAADLAKATYWSPDRAERLVNMTQKWRQLLFQGPPGTGKTYVAELLAKLLSGDEDGRVEVVQFHPSYAYEDFVEGIRPVVSEGSDLAYEVRKGILLKLTDLAKEHEKDEFFLVIDELNRANVARVLGELLYAMEYRGPEHPFRLPYSGGEAYLPPNLTFIATMNTADRSIALVDAALRRRFRHIEFAPDTKVLEAWLKDHDLGDVASKVADRLTALNAQLLQLVDRDRLIGHTFLMRADLREVGLEAVWDEDIGPALQEHLYGQPDEIVTLREAFIAPL